MPPSRPASAETAAESALAGELRTVRPDLLSPYADQLPGARAAVLTRLWRGLTLDPLPWITRKEPGREGLTLRLADGRSLHGPRPDPYATAPYVTELDLDGEVHDQPARLMTALGRAADFAAELDHSTASLALSRAGQPAKEGTPATGWEWEQRVVDGHPYHPNCRSRPGFSAAEQLAYAPEHRPVVELGLVPAGEDALVRGEWPDRFRDGRRVLVPVHPWQSAHVLRRGGELAFPAHPLMSLRTLATPDGLHVKTSLSARLTSSVRDISIGSVRTAAIVSDFAETFAARTDGLLHITRTLGAATAGTPDLAAVLREAPEGYAGPGERVVPVAALATTDLPQSAHWLAEFARLTMTVGLLLLDLGVALEAHGQNLMVVLSPAGTPLRLVYRDLADIRVSPARLAHHGIPAPDLATRMITDDETALRRKLFGSLITGTLGATAGSTPALAEALHAVVRDLPRTPDLIAFEKGPVPTKALTRMRLSPEPGDSWTTAPNPLGPATAP
ncbi:IucA/IucC family protein [Streptomyces cavernae]|uniref:IucA/IucC family protein n=1 Tax=Streptomyces cavernae TaxID=2259034 RepID=UPI000FEB73AA|nr:IucA/IucC family siderophore biosynthesis protein [Streptomyces cavernae]